MKRLFLSLVSAIALGLGAMAQDSRVATLQHGANFRTYYGTDAFISAHNDASDGDVITLTAGEFNLCEVTKAITVRGEGMNQTSLCGDKEFKIPQGSSTVLCLEGLTLPWDCNRFFSSNGGSATVVISKCRINTWHTYFRNCNAVIADTEIQCNSGSDGCVHSDQNSSVICTNCRFLMDYLDGRAFDIKNCIIRGKIQGISNSIIKNSIIYGVTKLNDTNISSNCLVKFGSSGFANSWYVKTEPDVNPDPWGEDPETPVLWADLFGEDYHLTEAAAKTYLGTDGTQVGIYGGAYPYDETPDYPLVKNLEVKGIHEDGKLQVKINVE